MAVIETWLNQDLQKPVKVQYIDGSLFSNNGNGNRIGVVVTDNGEPVTISGTVSGYVVVSDGSTVPCTGAKSGNRASILIPPAAYVPGSAFISLFITDGTTVTTLAAVSTTVLQTRTGTQVDPGSVVTDWTQTINGAMQDVQTAAANLGSIVATPYASLTYPVPLGKYTYYDGGLYRCISPIASSEAFTPAHWTAVKLGDDVSDLKSALFTSTGNLLLPVVNGKYINLSGTSADINSPASLAGMKYTVDTCSPGDKYTISMRGGGSGRAYGFLSSNGTILEVAPANVIYTEKVVTAPENAVTFVANSYQNDLIAYRGELLVNRFNKLTAETAEEKTNVKNTFNGIAIANKTLGASDFKQGYLGNNGFVNSGTEANKYITFLSESKALKGTKVSYNCNSQVASIFVCESNIWDSAPTTLETHAYASSGEFVINYDGFIVVTIATSATYAERTSIVPSDYNSSIVIDFELNKKIDSVTLIDEIESAQLKNGRLADGVAYTSDPKYILYCTDYMEAGTIINFSDENLYAIIAICSNGLWDGTAQVLYSTSTYEKEIELQTEVGGYVGIVMANGKVYADRTNIVPSDFTGTLSISKANLINVIDERIKSSTAGQYELEAPIINFKKNIYNYNVYSNSWNFEKPTGLGAESGQGATLYDGVVFKCWHLGVISTYDVDTGEMLGAFSADSGHGNNISFGGVKYDETDRFPLAYLSPETSETIETVRYCHVPVLRLTTQSATTVRTLMLPGDDCGYYIDVVVDDKTGYLYSVGYSVYPISTVANMIISVWDTTNIQQISDGKYVPTLVKKFEIPYILVHQGATWFDNKIFIISSEPEAAGVTVDTKVYIIDPDQESIIGIMNQFPTIIKEHECEAIWFKEGITKYDMFISRLTQIYKIEFN